MGRRLETKESLRNDIAVLTGNKQKLQKDISLPNAVLALRKEEEELKLSLVAIRDKARKETERGRLDCLRQQKDAAYNILITKRGIEESISHLHVERKKLLAKIGSLNADRLCLDEEIEAKNKEAKEEEEFRKEYYSKQCLSIKHRWEEIRETEWEQSAKKLKLEKDREDIQIRKDSLLKKESEFLNFYSKSCTSIEVREQALISEQDMFKSKEQEFLNKKNKFECDYRKKEASIKADLKSLKIKSQQLDKLEEEIYIKQEKLHREIIDLNNNKEILKEYKLRIEAIKRQIKNKDRDHRWEDDG